MPAVTLPPTPPVLVLAPYQSADWILDHLRPRGRIVGMTKGHLSLMDLVAAALKKTGPARLLILVWGIMDEDVAKLQALRDSGKLTAIKMLVPHAGPHDKDDYDGLREMFGTDNIVHTSTHAKVALLQNETWSLAIRGSINMYPTSHAEQFDIDDSAEICAVVRDYERAPQIKAAYPKPGVDIQQARADVADLAPGARIFGITASYSLGALLRAVLEKTGPAKIGLVTARLSEPEAKWIAGTSADLRVVLGQSVVALAKQTAKNVCRSLGAERVRVTMVHAKIVTIRNDLWNISIRSSMNLSANLRAEQFDITDDSAVADQTDQWIGYVFSKTPPGVSTAQTTISNVMRHMFGQSATGGHAAHTGPIALNAFRPPSLRVLPAAGFHTKPPFVSHPITLPATEPALGRAPQLPLLSLGAPMPRAATKSSPPRG